MFRTVFEINIHFLYDINKLIFYNWYDFTLYEVESEVAYIHVI